MADGIPIPGRRDLRRMILVHAHMAHFRALAIDHQNAVRSLEDLHQEIPENVRHAARPTLVARRRIAFAGHRDFTVLLHDLGRPGLQDRIGVITDELLEVRNAVGPPRSVAHGAGPCRRRLETGEIRMSPYAREIRYGPGWNSARRRYCRRYRLRPARCRKRAKRRRRQKEIPALHIHAQLRNSVVMDRRRSRATGK
jgi:hypothetical protein